jgi:hypothetical protein
MTRTCAVFCLWLASLVAAQAEDLRSDYSALEKCRKLPRLKLPDRTLETGDSVALRKCTGLDGYSVDMIDTDPRGWLVLERAGKMASLERDMVGEFKLGYFPVVSGNKVEWRLDTQGRAVGFIVRVAYQKPDVDATSPAANGSAPMVFDLRGAHPLLLGTTPSNVEVRALIDAALRRAQ